MEKRQVYFVYGHIDDNGQLFYIGCGNESRLTNTVSRAPKWCEHKDTYGLAGVVVLHETTDKDGALQIEKQTIERALTGGHPLTNTVYGKHKSRKGFDGVAGFSEIRTVYKGIVYRWLKQVPTDLQERVGKVRLSETLPKDREAALARAKELNAHWDSLFTEMRAA